MAAGVSVARHGTVQVTLEEVKKEIEASLSLPQTASVLFSNTRSLNQQVKQWQLEGLSVGFTNGCFDLLHAGHLHSLANAKKQCNKLVVALNSDESVKALKGPHRPVQDQHTRAQVLCALRMVDAVVVFNEDTPAKLIEMLLPNVMFKGADYRNKEVAGAKSVLDAGGKVVLIDLLEGHSTTTTVEKLNKGL
jgi:D-beta-D-heptose 7-phosphate kinase/D-beta-D-heptose 1-phosphate adenosyltransferase